MRLAGVLLPLLLQACWVATQDNQIASKAIAFQGEYWAAAPCCCPGWGGKLGLDTAQRWLSPPSWPTSQACAALTACFWGTLGWETQGDHVEGELRAVVWAIFLCSKDSVMMGKCCPLPYSLPA